MHRGTRLIVLSAVTCAVACGSGRQFSSRETAGAAGVDEGSGGARAGAGGKSTGSGGTSRGGASNGGKSGSGGAQGGSGSDAAGGTSSAEGGTGASSGGNAADGGTGALGEGGDDASGGTEATGGNGASAGSGSGGDGGSNPAGGSSNGGAGAGGSGADGAGGSGAAGSGAGTSGGGTSNTGGSGGQIGGCNNQLLSNGDFDAGLPTSSWQQESDLNFELIVRSDDSALIKTGVSPHSGDFLAWLGGSEDDLWDHHLTSLRQQVTIPAEANRLTLTGRYWIITEDDLTNPYDLSYLEFEANEDLIWQALPLSNANHSNGWVSFEKSTGEMDRLAGRTVTFLAYARTDLNGKTSFFFDSLRLEASCGR